MTFLPIVARELRVSSRAGATYWTRLVAALVALVVGGWTFTITSRFQAANAIGKSIFDGLAICAFVYCLLIGTRNTADCLSGEKREGTLGLLFLTDLRGYDIVFGKLAATSLNAFYGLLAIVPVMAIPLLLGGVPAAQFWRVTLVLVNTLFFSLAVGLFVSAFSRHERKAVGGTILLLLLVTAALPALGAAFAEYFNWPGQRPPLCFLLPTPGYTLFQAMTSGPDYWTSLLVIHGLSWSFLALATLYLPHAWKDKPAGAQAVKWRERWQRLTHGRTASRARVRARLLTINPFCWLIARNRAQLAMVWGFLIVVAAVWLWAYVKWKQDWLEEAVYVMTALLLHSVLKVWIASQASFQLAQDRASGALELLLSTPLTPADILRGQRLALQRQFALPLLLVLAIDIVFLLTDKSDNDWVTVWLAGMGMLVADVITLHFVGAWAGLTAKHASRAASSAIGRVMIFPWLVFYLAISLAALSLRNVLAPIGSEGSLLTLLWFAIGIVTDLGFGLWAWHRLRTDFRAVATQRFAGQLEARGFRRVGRALGRMVGRMGEGKGMVNG